MFIVVVATEDDKLPIEELNPLVVVATEPDRLAILELSPTVVVAIEELNSPIDELRLPSVAAIDALKSDVVIAIELLKDPMDDVIDPVNVEYPVVPVILICIDPDLTASTFNLSLMVVLIDDVNVFKLPVLASKLFNLPSCVELVVAIDELRLFVVVAIELDKLPMLELRPLVVVATDELSPSIDEDIEELNVEYPVTPVSST